MQDIKDKVAEALEFLDNLPKDDSFRREIDASIRFAETIKELREREAKLIETLKYIDKACLCERFPSRKIKRGFDYHESHPQLGNCSGGGRWLTPKDKIKGTLEELGY